MKENREKIKEKRETRQREKGKENREKRTSESKCEQVRASEGK